MNELTFYLCKKPVIGVAMWLSSLCVTNQLLKNTFVDLSKEGTIIDQTIESPMDEQYHLMLSFAPFDNYDSENPRRSFFSHFCARPEEAREAWKSPNQRLTLDLEITTPSGQPLIHEAFNPMCERNPGNPRDLVLGGIDLKRGTYRLTITNRTTISLESEGKTQILLRGTGAGYP